MIQKAAVLDVLTLCNRCDCSQKDWKCLNGAA